MSLLPLQGRTLPAGYQPSNNIDSLSDINAPRQVAALPLKTGEITLDGKLNEKIWLEAQYTSGFLQRQPNEGNRSTEETEVAFYYDDEALYIGARMYSSEPEKIQTQVGRRDNQGNSQRLTISLDTFLDRRTAISFSISVSGVRADYFQPEDEINFRSRDYTVDPVWEAKSNIDSLGWTAEMRIPFSQLRFNDTEKQIWGLNINRFIPRKNEDTFWVLVPEDETGWASRFGLLTGIEDVTPTSRLEFLPYVAGNSLITNPDPQNPFLADMNFEARAGGNVEYGLGPNLTLNAAINPDFGQVEIDPAQVNLSAFETIFEEKRPFFTEGQQLFDVLGGGRETYFFSRRIGAPPTLNPDADFVESSPNTSILGATKITGRLPTGLSIGGMTALTAKEKARVFNIENDESGKVEVEPLTSYNVLRMQQEFGTNGSTAGFILTGVYRDLKDGTQLAERLHRTALTGATDWNIRFQEGKYQLTGDLGVSYVEGSSGAILRTQRRSAHYFQRPDASYLSLDSTTTSLTGARASLEFSKNAGRHWLWEVGGSTKTPGFEANDAGILFQADEISTRNELTFRENTPGSWYQEYNLELSANLEWNYGGVRKNNEFQLQGRVEYNNFWSTFLSFEYSPRSFDDRLTRGGPLMKSPERKQVFLSLSTDRSSEIFGNISSSYEFDELGGYDFNVNGRVQIRPGGNLEYSLRPRYSMQTDKRQYITTLADGPAETFGSRYVFSTIDRTTIAMQFRVNYAFNPDLTLELFAEPFVSGGSFRNPGQLARPGDLKLDRFESVDVSPDGDFLINDSGTQFEVNDPDFLIKSFRSNLVLRYEWKPGSTFFLVWQSDLSSRSDLDRFVRPDDLIDTFRQGGDNIFAVKFTYWFPVN